MSRSTAPGPTPARSTSASRAADPSGSRSLSRRAGASGSAARTQAPRPVALRRRALSLWGAFVLLLALGPVPAVAAPTESVSIVRIWPGYRTAESFKTVGELFDGGEREGGRIVRRTQPAAREGFYFLTRLKLAQPLPGSEVRLEWVLPASANVVTHRFALDLPSGEPVLHLGITGADWPGGVSRPVAWRLSVRDAGTGRLLAQSQSSLWTAP